MSIEFKISGDRRVVAALDKYEAVIADAFEEGLLEAGEFLKEKSQEIVPVDTGALHDSAYAELDGSGLDAQVEVGYTEEYAIYVHEDMHARHAFGTRAKFLEEPMRRFAGQMQKIIADSTKGLRI